MMFYRRKILLALIQAFGGRVNNTDFQKYLFLVNEFTSKTYYNFVPYKYGCFSFQSYSDKRTLTKYNILKDYDDAWIKNDEVDYLSMLSNSDRAAMNKLKVNFSSLKGDDLIKYIYRKYPYYATRSELMEKLLTPEEMEVVNKKRNSDHTIKLFTLGYENRDIDEFANQLLLNNIKVLCDVRKNPVSMKFGFSKKQLKDTFEKFDIEYVHIPELGIDSDKRKNAALAGDYKLLFDEYSNDVSNNKSEYIVNILNLLTEYKRVALVCFEYDPSDCHRSRIAQLASELSRNKLNVANL
jgi:uncharacterized protein (DUF488 family)